MALIPGIFIKGKFKPLCQCNTKELEQAIYTTKIKMAIVCACAGVIIGLAICLFK